VSSLVAIYAAAGLVAGLLAYLAGGLRTVEPYERGVVLRFGKLHRIANPGRNLILPWLDRFLIVDMRPFAFAIDIPVLTSREGTWHRATLSAECHLLQPERAVHAVPDHIEATRALIESVFREAASGLAAEELRTDRSGLGRGLKKLANEQALSWGVDIQTVELLAIEPLAAPGPGEEARWEVVLTSHNGSPNRSIRLIREATGLDLKAAKELVDSAPIRVAAGLTLQAAEALRARLLATGAVVSLNHTVAQRHPDALPGSP
jgi:ribosomal protein L7/L12